MGVTSPSPVTVAVSVSVAPRTMDDVVGAVVISGPGPLAVKHSSVADPSEDEV